MTYPPQQPYEYPDQNSDIEEVEIDEKDHVDTGDEVPSDEVDKC